MTSHDALLHLARLIQVKLVTALPHLRSIASEESQLDIYLQITHPRNYPQRRLSSPIIPSSKTVTPSSLHSNATQSGEVELDAGEETEYIGTKDDVIKRLLAMDVSDYTRDKIVAVRRAKRNLRSCLIGRVEDLDSSYLLVKHYLPWLSAELKPNSLNSHILNRNSKKNPHSFRDDVANAIRW
jgi:hypothetical protein